MYLSLSVSLLTLGAHAPEGYSTWSVCLSVCVCVCVCVCVFLPILAPRAIRRTNSSISDFSAIRA